MSERKYKEYQALLASIHQELGISSGYVEECGLECQGECLNLVETELDIFSRQPLMEEKAYAAWQKMKAQALAEGVELVIISAFRSAEYQKHLFLKKIEAGQLIQDILKVNAAPGYSEHHSGQALDIGCSECEHLSEEFENTKSFQWLTENARHFGFTLSFPRNNVYGFLYEPWHWKYSD